jgi:hypothetical protein
MAAALSGDCRHFCMQQNQPIAQEQIDKLLPKTLAFPPCLGLLRLRDIIAGFCEPQNSHKAARTRQNRTKRMFMRMAA